MKSDLPRLLIAGTFFLLLGACDGRYQSTTLEPIVLSDAIIQRTLETQLSGQPLNWQNIDAGSLGSITPLRSFRTSEGRYCREFEVTYETDDGRDGQFMDIACRFEDGVWLRTRSSASLQ